MAKRRKQTKREINIVPNKQYEQLMNKLGEKEERLNPWSIFQFNEPNKTLEICGKVMQVKFVDESIGSFFTIDRFDHDCIWLEKFDNFELMCQVD